MAEPPHEGLTVLIVDDEALARQRLRRFLNEVEPTAKVVEADNGLKALAALSDRTASFDVVFLDVQMPGMTGLEALAQLPVARRQFKLVFQTAYDEFAVKAFEENALDYLLKPFDLPRFRGAWDRAASAASLTRKLAAMKLRGLDGGEFFDRLALRRGPDFAVVDVADVHCLVSRDHYTCVYGDDGRELLTEMSLGTLAARLDTARFLRIHRKSLVNLEKVVALSAVTEGKGGGEVTMANGMRLDVARRERSALKSRLAQEKNRGDKLAREPTS